MTDKKTNEQTDKRTLRKALTFASGDFINPLESRGNYSATSNNKQLVHWPLMGVTFGTARRGLGGAPLIVVRNVTAYPSTASVPITVLLWSAALRFSRGH